MCDKVSYHLTVALPPRNSRKLLLMVAHAVCYAPQHGQLLAQAADPASAASCEDIIKLCTSQQFQAEMQFAELILLHADYMTHAAK